ncbi:pyridoxal phosphate-dependent aminotransferase [Brevundimonas diminuta]|uniref:pyridoxal phosphate-dependent aminotransferase n=1 Tax=Brevundimonas diminuta TaxID=293 RepID=UPI0037CA5FDF
MNVSGVIANINEGGEAYSQWIRHALTRCARQGRKVDVLFGSSIDEPTDLLRALIEEGFRTPITDRYQSPFVGGNPAVVTHLCARYGVEPEQVLCTTGATAALALVYKTYLNTGDRVLVETPGFDLFADLALAQGAGVDVFERAAPNYGLDLEAVERAMTDRTRVIVVSNLHNPSGTLIGDEVLADLARLAERRGALLVVDEVYGDYADKSARPGAACRLGDAVLSINSMTKIYGLSTVRCGWVVGAADLIGAIRRVSDRFDFGVSKLGHAVAALVLDHQAEFDARAQAGVAAGRDAMARALEAWEAEGLASAVMPDFGCIVFPQIHGIADTAAFSDWLADEMGVIVAPGEFFGAPGFVRIGFAMPADALTAALDRFAEGVRTYRALDTAPSAESLRTAS